MSSPRQIVVSGAFDDLRARHVRFLQEASKHGTVTVLLWPDDMLLQITGKPPRFPLAERVYLLNAVRFVSAVVAVSAPLDPDTLPSRHDFQPQVWIDVEGPSSAVRREFCRQNHLGYQSLPASQLDGFPEPLRSPSLPARKKVVVTGCYDWFHSGHVRFFEEVSTYGDLYVMVGNDHNLRLLKGEGHPQFPQEERRYLVGSIRHVEQALISSGQGWLDAEPEIRRLKPDIYAVNEDGDKGGKREYCEKMGIQYLVLRREPAPGLQPRTSTDLRGF